VFLYCADAIIVVSKESECVHERHLPLAAGLLFSVQVSRVSTFVAVGLGIMHGSDSETKDGL